MGRFYPAEKTDWRADWPAADDEETGSVEDPSHEERIAQLEAQFEELADRLTARVVALEERGKEPG